jgi:hypothetical protein
VENGEGLLKDGEEFIEAGEKYMGHSKEFIK